MNEVARRAELRGVVQGVGFRPFVLRLARRLGLSGIVRNRGGAVVIEVEGARASLDAFAERLIAEAPTEARIDAVAWTDLPVAGRRGFAIDPSETEVGGGLAIGPDQRVCAACMVEIHDPTDRRFGYGLNGCTRCGPRLSIAVESPWQRASSSMAGFPPCRACNGEFDDPADRRFHAEAIACPRCGPNLRLEDGEGRTLESDPTAAIDQAAELVRRGGIVALQGIGGFQLLVDAGQQAAVLRLRERKHRPAKPLALMVLDLPAAEALAWVDPVERELLDSPAGPIVLLRRRPGSAIAEAVAHARPTLGLMLATTPVHALLLAQIGGPLIATSGNVHGRPIAITHADARAQLGAVADALLVHDRVIQRRCDDSLTQVVAGRSRVLRLGRGLAPATFELPDEFAGVPGMLALGGQLGHAPILVANARATAWPHVGDLDEAHTRAAMRESIADLERLAGCTAKLLAIDAHPDYASSVWAHEQPGRRCLQVFHHHAHVAAVLAEHRRDQALGVAWDGTGLGPDQTAWGGEFLQVDARGARRVAHLRAFRLPGGDAAARDGSRALAGMLATAGLDPPPELAQLVELAQHPKLSPLTTSVGRMFDAVAALTGLCSRSRYQAEAAQALEHAASPGAPPYPFTLRDGVLDWQPMLTTMLGERERPDLVASRFHATLIAMIVAVAIAEAAPTVVLAGGCFANRLLLDGAIVALRARGIEPLAAERLPPGDGGLALGQAWVVGHQWLAEVR